MSIQNEEAKIDLSLAEQPDLTDIARFYQKDGGNFWIALADGKVIGTVGLMMKENGCAVLKKFFVQKAYRSQKVGLALYTQLLTFAAGKGVKHVILDTPSVAHASHRFYERAGFRQITKAQLPAPCLDKAIRLQ